ncbi:MAG: RadC family protein [Candidatus Woesearchaeota archaeon]
MRIKDIPLENRPRERMKKLGLSVLSDAEVLALILQKGTHSDNVIDMSNKLIAKYGLEKLSSLSLTELSAIDGIGEAKAIQILAAFEMNKRIKSQIYELRIKSPVDVYNYFRERLKDLKKEHFYVLLLDTKNKIIKEELVFIGSLNSTIIHPREVFKLAIKESAASIILIHNHPSGDSEPSTEDLQMIKIFKETGILINIPVRDNMIVASDNYWSAADNDIT